MADRDRDPEPEPAEGVLDGPTPAARPEIWRLDHPQYGRLEFAVGRPDQVHAVDPGYPLRRKPEGDRRKSEGEAAEPSPLQSPGCALLRDGVTVARARQISDKKYPLDADPPEPGKHSTVVASVSGPRVQVRTSIMDTAVRQVVFREGRDVVHFDPPPGSAAEARQDAIAASPWKRVAYPVAAGLGRSGWAIAVIVLLPLIGRVLEPVVEWILERLPDIDIPWPDISVPSIPWPDISLPSISLPEVTVPGWVEFLLEYSKVWVPLVAGVAIAVLAVRHSRRSREIKRRWEAGRHEDSAGDDPASNEPSGDDEPSGDGDTGR
ncbi:hypothetical protein NGF75_15045 [Dietzia kunjamensis]|uniref:hypothetical protein n=1 Tax=Dietzia kunjamensis TaxID=322509 RepID=UPI002DC04926|nr:hypothetical protein [Dietzia kunjamensis]MEB8327295.1 hypothetical protein [Dietzia kunjamensis]